ncbi:hypothetical protein GN956_G21676 [Arapaima gigas]
MAPCLSSWPLALICLALCTEVESQQVVADRVTTTYRDENVALNCRLKTEPGLNIIQVEWKWKSAEGKEEVLVVHNPAHNPTHHPNSSFSGRISFNFQNKTYEMSIRITGVKLTDSGVFICLFNTFPNGKLQANTRLTVFERLPPLTPGTAAGVAAMVLLAAILLATSVYVVLKRRYVASAGIHSTCRSSAPSAAEDTDLNYAAIRVPSQTKSVVTRPLTQNESYYAEVKRSR